MLRLNKLPLVSVILCTKNEETNISNCIESIKNQTYPQDKIEIIVVDNNSSDNTVNIAKSHTDKVYNKNPKRATQLNYGVNKSTGKYILYPDADMTLSENVIKECVDLCEKGNVALYIPERIIGKGFWIKVRDYERSFYNATCIDAVRFVQKDKFLEINGFDENIDFGPDDWDFNRRIKQTGKTDIISSTLNHNEGEFSVTNYLNKKKKYMPTFDKYIDKWSKDDPIIRMQLGAYYRLFGVFTENGKWNKMTTKPSLLLGLYLLRVMVGIQYLKKSITK